MFLFVCVCQDSVICVDDQTASPLKEPEKMKTQKPLRSLNDVLGKAAPPGKASSGSFYSFLLTKTVISRFIL